MRLLNTKTLELELFPGKPPEYAILSHTWDAGEVSLQDFAIPDRVQLLPGYEKVLRTCRLAQCDGIPYAWVDTCCIDKTSSAELSEAINSMFRWYANSKKAYAFLSDWKPHLGAHTNVTGGGKVEQLEDCRWFTRGWTLQELIAPVNLDFFDCEWNLCGTKSSLSSQLTKITGMSKYVLSDARYISLLPVAVKMSWAAGRKTSREEDVAYSLLGIFDVNMPMLYGEGKKAFRRLQEAIIAEVNDLTIFAWEAKDCAHGYRGVLASSPDEFKDMGELERTINSVESPGFTVTNKGVRMNVGLTFDSYILDLHCFRPLSDHEMEFSGITLEKIGSDSYVRANAEMLAKSKRPFVSDKPTEINLLTRFPRRR